MGKSSLKRSLYQLLTEGVIMITLLKPSKKILLGTFLLCSLILLSSCTSNVEMSVSDGSDTDSSYIVPEGTVSTTSVISGSEVSTTDETGEDLPVSPFGNLSDPNKDAYSDDVRMYIPEVTKEKHIDSDEIKSFTPDEKISPVAHASGTWISYIYGGYNGIRIEEYALYDDEANALTQITYPKDFPKWNYGSNSELVMQDRYFYEWKSYADNALRLTRIDVRDKKIEVLRTTIDDGISPSGVSFAKLDEERFLMYYQYYAPEGDVYDYYNVLEVCDVDGNYTEILREGRIDAYFAKEEDETEGGGAQQFSPNEKKASSDSVGYYNTAYAVKDGEIYALAHQTISEESKWTLRRFSNTGEELGRIPLNNFGYISDMAFVESFAIIGDYFLVSDNYYGNCYICKINGGDDRIIFKCEGEHNGVRKTSNFFYCAYNDKYFAIRVLEKKQSVAQNYIFDPASGETTLLTFDLNKEFDTISYSSKFIFIDKGELCSAYYENQDFGEQTYYIIDLDSVMSGE